MILSTLTEKEQRYISANHAFHNTDKPLMTDSEFDLLKQELIAAGSLQTNVVGAPVVGSNIRKHVRPMLSLDNCFSAEALCAWVGKNLTTLRVSKLLFCLEDKLDGLACSLIYERGILIAANTRGDGTTGEDILSHVIHIPNIPTNLSSDLDLEIRGEIAIPQVSFEALNEELIAAGKKPLKSPRNTAVGAINANDPMTARDRGCMFYAYTLLDINNALDISTHHSAMRYLEDEGFDTANRRMTSNTEIPEMLVWAEQRMLSKTPVAIDGIVVKINDYVYQHVLGMNNTCPHWAVAYKTNSSIADTTLEDVIWQVGRTGIITPVGCLTKTRLAGADIDRVTLHNFDEITRLGVAIGDTVRMVRSGQVIPKITSVVVPGPNRYVIEAPTVCPSCNGTLSKRGSVYIECTNTGCPAMTRARLEYACSKDAVEIETVGPEVIADLMAGGKITTVPELYRDTMAEHLAQRFPATYDQRIEHYRKLVTKSRHTEMYRAVTALGITGVADITAKRIARYIKCLMDLTRVTPEQLGLIGYQAQQLSEYVQQPANVKVMQELDTLLTYDHLDTTDLLKDISFVVTGSFDIPLSRKSIEETIINNGGRLQSKVSDKTDWVVVGANAGSKRKDAERLGKVIMEQSAFVEFLNSKGL